MPAVHPDPVDSEALTHRSSPAAVGHWPGVPSSPGQEAEGCAAVKATALQLSLLSLPLCIADRQRYLCHASLWLLYELPVPRCWYLL